MNFSDFIKDNGKRINKQYYLNLIQVSKADGKIKPEELELLHKEGRKFGLTDPEIDMLIESEAGHYDPPYALQEKFNHLYNVAEIILADESVTEGERKLLRRFAIEAGFSDKTIEKLIELLFTGIKKGEDEETLLKRFRSEILFQD